MVQFRFIMHILVVLCAVSTALSQENDIQVNTDWDHERHAWASSWITHPSASRCDYGVFLLRNSFHLDQIPDSLIIYVSADNRYRLLINGQEILQGPARGSLMHWRYESMDISPYLAHGENIIAAEVFNLGAHRPAAQFSYQTAFIFQAEDNFGELLNTPGKWMITQNKAFNPIRVSGDMVRGYYVAGPTDEIKGWKYPWGWEDRDFNVSDWEVPERITRGVGRGYMHGVPWMLVPRTIPLMERKIEEISLIRKAEGIDPDPGFTSGSQALTIPPRTTCTILLDQEYLTTTYPRIELSGGKGSTLRITYAESLYNKNMQKGNRDEVDGKVMIGYYDLIRPGGGKNRQYHTLSTRTYRYLELEINTLDDPLAIERLYGIYTAYPFTRTARFTAGNPFLELVQDIGWRTARLCAGETYMDCPYYEQLQYLGDARIQALISLYVSGDDRLMRNTLMQADHSRLPEGLTLSRAPSAIPQIIPPFSLYWVAMVHDYYMHREDDEFVRSFLPGIRGVLGWFERRMRPDGLLGGLDWLNFTDWTEGFNVGSPPGVDQGGSALITLNLAYALDRASELFKQYGDLYNSTRYATLSQHVKGAVFTSCFNEERMLLADTPEQKEYSQHTNIFGILTDCIPEKYQKQALQQVMEDSTLVQTTIYYRFYLFRALLKSGMGDLYLDQLGPWKDMIDKGLTTWEEGDYDERSDCHAWGSSPNYDLLSIVCGINPGAPGFRQINISPNLGQLEHVKASMPHPSGTISVEYRHIPGKKLRALVELPPSTTGKISWGGQSFPLSAGRQSLSIDQ